MLIVTNHLHDINKLKIKLGKEFDMKDLDYTKNIIENHDSFKKSMLKMC